MRKIIFIVSLILSILSITKLSFADRDWEYWSRYSFEAPLNKQISYLIKPEWRFKKDMSSQYLFKLEQAIAFKVNKFLELAPYYVWQETRTSSCSMMLN